MILFGILDALIPCAKQVREAEARAEEASARHGELVEEALRLTHQTRQSIRAEALRQTVGEVGERLQRR
jgi:hypothetical protein